MMLETGDYVWHWNGNISDKNAPRGHHAIP